VSARSKTKVGLPPNRRMRHDRHFVDELAQRMGEGIGRMIRITAISANQDQPRSSLGALEDLQSSIDVHGVLEPLLVRPIDKGKYELISGERRFHAAMAVGLAEVPCIELRVNHQQALEIALIENLQRKDLTAFEEAEGYRTLISKYDYTHEQVAQAVGRSRVTVTETLRLLRIPDSIRDLCRHADITAKGILLEIAKTSSLETLAQLIQEIIEHRLDRAAIRQRRAQLDNDDQPSTVRDARTPEARKPYLIKFSHPDKVFSMSLSFRTEKEPEPRQVIEALREVIREIEASLGEKDSHPATE
jgi:ParB family chromosome partitioning protein